MSSTPIHLSFCPTLRATRSRFRAVALVFPSCTVSTRRVWSLPPHVWTRGMVGMSPTWMGSIGTRSRVQPIHTSVSNQERKGKIAMVRKSRVDALVHRRSVGWIRSVERQRSKSGLRRGPSKTARGPLSFVDRTVQDASSTVAIARRLGNAP